MKLILATVLVLFAVNAAPADIGPPPGFKRIPAEHKITTEKEYPDFVFFKVVGETATLVKLDPKTPAVVTGTGLGPYRSGRLAAVPKEASKKFDSEKEFLAAVGKGKVEGLLWAKPWFGGQTEVKVGETRKVIVTEYKIEKIDPKLGIVFAEDKKPEDQPAPPAPAKESPEDSDGTTPTAYTPKSGVWVAGLAGTFAIVLTGLWIARRGRRDLA